MRRRLLISAVDVMKSQHKRKPDGGNRLGLERLESRNLLAVDPAWFAEFTQGPTIIELPGDADSDGAVTVEDVQTLQDNFGARDASRSQGDFDLDGDVDFID